MTKQRILFYASLIAVVGLNLYFRSFPVAFPQLKSQARDMIDKSIQQMAMREVQQKFPQFYSTAKDEIVRTRIAEYKKQNRRIIQGQVQDLYRQLKNKYQDDTGQTYLMELDCWHWGRYVDNVVKFGHPGDEVIAGRQWDFFMLAPSGFFMLWEQFLYYLSAFFYKLFLAVTYVPLFKFLFYLPLFFAALFIIALYLFSFYYGRYIGAVMSCMFVGLAPIFLQRSSAGWFDTDILNLLFPILIVWTFIISYNNASFRHRAPWVILSSFLVGLFCFTWTHWWFIFLIILIYELIYSLCTFFAYIYFKKECLASLKQHIFSLFLFLTFSSLWIVFLSGTEPLKVFWKQIMQALTLNKPLMSSIWPNVYSTVGELRRMTFSEVARSAGSRLVFTFSLICMLILLLRVLFGKISSRRKRATIMIIAIWFICMFFASTRGVRFAVFLLVPLGISLGWCVNDLYEHFKSKNNLWSMSLVIIGVIIFCLSSAGRAADAAKSIFPLMDDTWYRVLNIVKEKSPPETVLNSWWDFGDWFKAVARRRVIFDGQSQDTPQAYWMAKVMLTDNENEAVSILRMLNNGGNKAFEIIDEHLKDSLLSVMLLENALLLPPERAQEILRKFLPSSAIESLRRILFYSPARADFIVDHTMPYKMPAISYLGNWDFSKVYIAQNFDRKEKDKIMGHLKNLGRDEQETQRFYQEVFLISTKNLDDWLSHRLQFYGPLANGREKDGMVFFDNGFAYNVKEGTLQSNANQIPRSLFIATEGGLAESVYPNANVIFSILIFKAEDGYKSILLDSELGRSMFVRLYFLNGKGLKHFIPFVNADEGNNYIRVFDIAW